MVFVINWFVCTPPHPIWLVDDLHLEISFSMLQTLAITNWASVNGSKDQLCGPTGVTSKQLAEKLKDRDEKKRKLKKDGGVPT